MISARHRSVCLGVIRINSDRYLELLDAPLQELVALLGSLRVSPPIETVKAAKVGIMRLWVDRSGPAEACLFLWRERNTDLARNRFGHFTLHCEHVAEATFIAVGPEMPIGRAVDEL